MLCPSCHTQNRDNAKYCKVCGHLLAVEVVAGQSEGTEQPAPLSDSQQQTMPEQQGTSVQNGAEALPAAPETPHAQGQPGDQSEPEQPVSDDSSQAPTQILTPERMQAYHTRLWQQEAERQTQPTQEPYQDDIADAPTLLIHPDASSPGSSHVSTYDRQDAEHSADIADMPTIVTHPHTDSDATSTAATSTDAHEQEAESDQGAVSQGQSVSAASVPAHEDVDTQQQQQDTEAPAKNVSGEEQKNSIEEEHLEPNREVEKTPLQEQEQPAQSEQSNQSGQPVSADGEQTSDTSSEQPASTDTTFPVLAVGTRSGDRYEVTQVISDDEQEHIYEVADRKGYLHCWNCGSEQNAEGDEFCVDCGAELLNAAYILHEYPPSSAHENDAQVLQGSIVTTFVENKNTYVVELPMATQNAFPNGVHLLVACDSDAGTVRRAEANEDSTLVLLLERVHESISMPAGLFIVADGMGGHANGQGASRATIALIAERVVRNLVLPPFDTEKKGEPAAALDDEQIKEIIRGAIEEANSSLCQMNQRDKSDAGSTLTGFMMVGDRAFIFNVGDSRTYMLRDGNLYQLTNDHSLVGQLVAGGLIEPEDVYTHPQRNQIFRSIGDKQNVQVDLFTQQVHPGDILLSCSDGLWEMVRDPQITDILNQAVDPQSACTQLIEAANANGGEDNVSAVLAFVR